MSKLCGMRAATFELDTFHEAEQITDGLSPFRQEMQMVRHHTVSVRPKGKSSAFRLQEIKQPERLL
ncbi:MAG: hypothetical protein WBL63_17755, partial [Candidatus Acidiferrum sp.]